MEHPHKDPLGIVGTIVGNPAFRSAEPIKVSVFSHPQLGEDASGKPVPSEAYRYGIKMNYYTAGRKAVTVIVTKEDIEKRGKELLIAETVKFLTEQADIIDRNAKGDYPIPWDSDNAEEAAEDEAD